MPNQNSPQNFEYAAGEAFVLQFDCDSVITGMMVRFKAARQPSGTPIITTEGGAPNATKQITGAQQFKISVDDAVTLALLGTLRYSAWVEDSFGAISEVAFGNLVFRPSVP